MAALKFYISSLFALPEVRKEKTYLVIKRVCDVVGVVLFSHYFCSVILAIAVAVKLTSRGPVFYRQARSGKDGRIFLIYKFRTMYAHLCDEDGAVQATLNDSRVTSFGRILRRFSMDELPQLLNILKGEMSFIGPRPHPLGLDDFYSRHIGFYTQRQYVTPGITGWAQVNGLRGETKDLLHMKLRVMHDMAYIRHQSLGLEFKIFLRTFKVWFSPDAGIDKVFSL